MLVSPRPRHRPALLFVFTTNSTQINEKERRDDESRHSDRTQSSASGQLPVYVVSKKYKVSFL